MRRNGTSLVLIALLAAFASSGFGRGSMEGFSAEAYRNQPAEFSPSFFWMWNSRLDADMLCGQLDMMASNGVMNVCIHPVPKAFRPGVFMSEMEPDYLTPGYLDVYAKVVEHAKAPKFFDIREAMVHGQNAGSAPEEIRSFADHFSFGKPLHPNITDHWAVRGK